MSYGFDPRPVIDRIRERIVESETGCWLWTGSVNAGGYGKVRVGSLSDGTRRKALVHRVAYELLVGPIPEGLTLDHLCHNADAGCPGGDACLHRRCCNPAHLEPATLKVNVLRGQALAALNARKTECVNGHPFDEANTYWRTDGRGRVCRTCSMARKAARRQKRSAMEVIG